MKINWDLDKALPDWKGNDIQITGVGPGSPRNLAVEVLLARFGDEMPPPSAEEVKERYALAKKIRKAKGKVSWTRQEADLIMKCAHLGYGPLVEGRLDDLIEGNTADWPCKEIDPADTTEGAP